MASVAVSRSTFLLVTRYTPAHLQWRSLLDNFHRLDGTVTFLASHLSSGNVHFVGESHVVRKIMDLGPLDRIVVFEFFREELDRLFVSRYKTVTTHTCIHRWYAGHRGSPSAGVTVLAWNLPVASMKLVAKWDGLGWLVTNVVHCISRRIEPPGLGSCRRHKNGQDHPKN